MNSRKRASSWFWFAFLRGVLGWMSIIVSALVGMMVMGGITYAVLSEMTGQGDLLGAVKDEEFRQTLAASVPAVVLLGAGAVGGVGLLRQRTLDATHRLERERHDDERVSGLRDRYTTVAEQLGHESAAIRMAGVYALGALADDWLARGGWGEAQVCISLLCAYFRTPRAINDREKENRGEREVRQTITRVITDHLQDPKKPSSWCGMDFDFTGSVFAGAHSFRRAQFTGGTVTFSGAQFTGGTVDFMDAEFTGGTVTFVGAKFANVTVFFSGAQFTGATVSFYGAEFTWRAVPSYKPEFTRGAASFHGAEFTRGAVTFRKTEFNGGATVHFPKATFSMRVPGPWPGDHPPEVYPPKESPSPEDSVS